MSNSIYMGGMSSYYNSFIQSTKNQKSSGTKVAENQTVATETKKDFFETVREKAKLFGKKNQKVHFGQEEQKEKKCRNAWRRRRLKEDWNNRNCWKNT